MSDAQLITSSRHGDSDAFAELYRRHVDAARSAARALARSKADVDDIVSEAFSRVLRVLQGGAGPEVSFRPYVLTTVRNVFYDRARRRREEPSDQLGDSVNLSGLEFADSAEDRGFVGAAFASLPERWQLVLWHTEVEGRSVSEVAPLLGLAPNAVAALAYRAREGLRQAFLQAQMTQARRPACEAVVAQLGAYVRDGLAARDRRKIDEHLRTCDTCPALVAELVDANTVLRAVLVPLVVGVSAQRYLAAFRATGLFGRTRHVARTHAVASAAAVATVLVAGGVAAAVTFGRNGGDREAVRASDPPVATVVVAPTATPSSAPVTSEVPIPTSSSSSTTVTTVAPTPPTSSTVPVVVPPPPAPPVTTKPKPKPKPTPTTSVTTPTPATSVPDTSVPATTSSTSPPPTTTMPPHVHVDIAQITPAMANVPLRVRIDLDAAGAALSGLTVDLPLPAGVTLVRGSNGWQCTASGTCTHGPAAAGPLRLDVTLDLGATPPAQITIAPVISGPDGVTGDVVALSITVEVVPSLLFGEIDRGAVTAIGNSVVTCSDADPSCAAARASSSGVDNNAFVLQYVDEAGVDTTNSSSAQLDITGSVTRAFLVWGGDVDQGTPGAVDASQRGTVVLIGPDGVAHTVTAGAVHDLPGGLYTADADVTDLVSGSGAYTVGNVQTALGAGSCGGWSLVVVTADASQPERLLLVAAPGSYLTATSPMSISLPMGTAMSGSAATVSVVGFEGDPDLGGDQLVVNGTVTNNAFASSVPSPGNPAPANTFGTDVLVEHLVAVGGSSVDVAATTTNDFVAIAAVTVQVDVPA